jgi:hypothetical protein
MRKLYEILKADDQRNIVYSDYLHYANLIKKSINSASVGFFFDSGV